eukprot:5090480-Prymnesium_polylepis.1
MSGMALRPFFGPPDSYVVLSACPSTSVWTAFNRSQCSLGCTSPTLYADASPVYDFCCDLGGYTTGATIRFVVLAHLAPLSRCAHTPVPGSAFHG